MIALVILASRFFNQDHQYQNALALLETLLNELPDAPLSAAEKANYEPALRTNLGRTLYLLGDTDTALEHLNRALTGYRTTMNLEEQAVVLANRALIQDERANFEAALSDYLEALELQKKVLQIATNDTKNSLQSQLVKFRAPFNLGTLYNNIGSLRHTLAQDDKAESAFEEALKYHRMTPSRTGEIATLHNLGQLLLDIGKWDQAIEKLTNALELDQTTTKNPLQQGHVLHTLGKAYEAKGDVQAALQQYKAALDRFRAIENRPGIAFVLNNIGLTQLKRDAYAEAEPPLQEALRIFHELGYRTDQSEVLSNLGYLQKQRGNISEALRGIVKP
ncbi:MAG: tetratricopeptide repeat protein [Anaerolineae bacterium]|nr:tetratricopeptide repeat protein [Anaerolineae bacterium]